MDTGMNKSKKFVIVDVTILATRFKAEAKQVSKEDEFYSMDFDTLIWDVCIMGGKPGFDTNGYSENYHDRVNCYMQNFNMIMGRTIGWRKYTFCTPLEVRGTVLVLADLSEYPENYFWIGE